MSWVRCRTLHVLLIIGLAMTLASCSSVRSREEREEREARINVYPENYRADLLAALHTYVSDPTHIRDAFVSEPALKPVGRQNRYAACVRFNARNSDGRYVGSKDVLAIFVAGRFDQFIDTSVQLGPTNEPNRSAVAKELCDTAEYRRFPELEALAR